MFKFVLYAEGNCFWADRMNRQLFGPSAILKQETPCGQFYEPLLEPMSHYIPVDFFFNDLLDRINWAQVKLLALFSRGTKWWQKNGTRRIGGCDDDAQRPPYLPSFFPRLTRSTMKKFNRLYEMLMTLRIAF